MTNGGRLALNPYSACGKMCTPAEIQALLAGEEAGVEAKVIQANQQVLVGAAAHVPPRLPGVLQAMAGFGSVSVGELTGGKTLDVVVVPPGSDNPYLTSVRRFYERRPQADTPPARKRRWGRKA